MKKLKSYRLGFLIFCLILAFIFFRDRTPSENSRLSNTSIVLGSDDVAMAKKENFMLRVPISGELYPLNQTTVIAKVTAEAQAVYVREGQPVKKDQLLAQLNTADLRQALEDKKAAVSAAEASYQFSIAATQRYKKLLEKSFYSRNDYDTAINQLKINKAAVKQAKAALNEAKLQLKYATVISSLEGIVSERDVDPGMNVSVGQTLFKVVNLDHLEWRAVVPADQISHIAVGQMAVFEVDGIQQSFSGKVVRINPNTVAGTRAYYAYIDVDNMSQQLKNGMFAIGGIILNEQKNAITIPFEAVRHGNYVYKVDAKQQIQKQPVKLGLIDVASNKVEIISGLKAGDWVLVSAVEVQPGNAVILPVK